MPGDLPTTLLAELTHRCPLHCPYCSNPLELLRADSELTTDDWKRVFTQARSLGVLQLGLSGGEPLLRKDLEELAAHAHAVGLYTTLVTSGLGLTRGRAERLKEAGLEHIQVSIQDSDPEVAERIAGVRSVKHKQAAAALVRELGFAFTVNVVLHRANLDRIGEIIDMAADLGADRIELANTQYYGWGLLNRATLQPTREQVERSRDVAERAIQRYRGRMQITYVLPDYYEPYPKACYGGWGSSIWWSRQTAARCPVTAPPRSPPDVRQRAGPFARMDLARVRGFSDVPGRQLDEGPLPQLPPQSGGLRGMSLPGFRPHRGRRQYRPGMYPDPVTPNRRPGTPGAGPSGARVPVPPYHCRAGGGVRGIRLRSSCRVESGDLEAR